MKKHLYLLLLALAGVAAVAKAQVPGYQGKRFSVGVNASSFAFFDYLHDFPEGLRMSYKTEANVNYVLSRKVNAGVSYYYGKQKYYFAEQLQVDYRGQFLPKADYVPCRLQIIELHLQFFRKNFVAPAGLYHQFGVGFVNYNLATPDHRLLLQEVGSTYSRDTLSIDGPTEHYTAIKLSYHLGMTTPIGHRFYMNAAIGVNFFRGGDAAKIVGNLTNQNYILSGLNRGIRRQNFAELKVGFGWFAF